MATEQPPMTSLDVRNMLGEGLHTAFRKASDHPSAQVIWRYISDMPPGEWTAIVQWVADPLADAIRARGLE